jgi:hypothetical protein
MACVVLAGCATPIKVDNQPTPIIITQPSEPSPIITSSVNWQVVTGNNLQQFVVQAQKDQGTTDPVFVVLTVDDYKVLLANLTDIKRYIQQQQAIIAYYQTATRVPKNK